MMCINDPFAEYRQFVHEASMKHSLQVADARIIELEKEVAHWKANHDNQVKLKSALMDRPDLKDRATKVHALFKHVEVLSAFLGEAIALAKQDRLPQEVTCQLWQSAIDRARK
jgi:hypothetical protein